MLIITYARDPAFLSRLPFAFELDPQLAKIDQLLNDQKLILMVANDLALSAPQALWNSLKTTLADRPPRSL